MGSHKERDLRQISDSALVGGQTLKVEVMAARDRPSRPPVASIGPLAAPDEDQEPESAGGEAGGRVGLVVKAAEFGCKAAMRHKTFCAMKNLGASA
jgi:hypothetical protein